MKPKFSKWVQWSERNKLNDISSPGIYFIAIDEKKDLISKAFQYDKKIIYIGMSNSMKGLKGRLKKFDSTIHGGRGHSAAYRVKGRYENYDELTKKLVVAIASFDCERNIANPNDLLVMGEVAKLEYVAFANYVKLHGNLPEFNQKQSKAKVC